MWVSQQLACQKYYICLTLLKVSFGFDGVRNHSNSTNGNVRMRFLEGLCKRNLNGHWFNDWKPSEPKNLPDTLESQGFFDGPSSLRNCNLSSLCLFPEVSQRGWSFVGYPNSSTHPHRFSQERPPIRVHSTLQKGVSSKLRGSF